MQQVSSTLCSGAALFLNFMLLLQCISSTCQENDVKLSFTKRNNNNVDSHTNQILNKGRSKCTKNYGPVIFVPGVGGSQLEAKLNKTRRVHRVCRLQSNWFNLWLNMHLLTPISFDCLVDNMRLLYDNTTKLTSNSQGVDLQTLQFGLLEGVEYLDHSLHLPKTGYFHSIISSLKNELNYLESNENVFGASYDFRKAPNELGEFFENLTQLVEHQYYRNNYRPITIICHSMGCLNTLYLMNLKSQQWKDVYIRRLIALAAPWKGSYKALSSLLLGDNLGVPILNGHKLRDLQITFPSLMYLFPQEDTFNKPRGRVLVETMNKNYSFDNLSELFQNGQMFDQLDMWLNIRDYVKNFQAPNVELWCLYGEGIQTPSKVVYEGELLISPARQVMSDGDGTVNLESSLACSQYQQDQLNLPNGKPVYLKAFEGTSHVDGMLRSKQVSDYIVEKIFKGEG